MEICVSSSAYLKFVEMRDKLPLSEEELMDVIIAHTYAHLKGGEML